MPAEKSEVVIEAADIEQVADLIQRWRCLANRTLVVI